MTEDENHYYAVKTTSKQERAVADAIYRNIERRLVDIKVVSVIVPEELKGYVIIESPEGRG